jgi:hypothetical protein
MPRPQPPFEWQLERDMIYWNRLRMLRRKRMLRDVIINIVLLLTLTVAVTALHFMH